MHYVSPRVGAVGTYMSVCHTRDCDQFSADAKCLVESLIAPMQRDYCARVKSLMIYHPSLSRKANHEEHELYQRYHVAT